MGLLTKGTPLSWKESKKYLKYVKEHGIIQFINIYNTLKDRSGDNFLWGDEVEYMMVYIPKDKKIIKLSLTFPQVIKILESKEEDGDSDENPMKHVHFVPEYGRWMIEGTPARPYGSFTSDLRLVEANMRLRRQLVQSVLPEDVRILSIGSFPRMGTSNFTWPITQPHGPVALSDYVSDEVINDHPRFATLTANIRERRGRKVDIRVPMFKDINTAAHLAATANIQNIKQEPLALPATGTAIGVSSNNSSSNSSNSSSTSSQSESSSEEKTEATLNGVVDSDKLEIDMDCMAFGMGNCCLQVTFQARNLPEARHLYDQLAVISPILLALTAATPFYRGFVSDNDVRWTVIAQSVDDRTEGEMGLRPLAAGEKRIYKSRYDSIDSFISLEKTLKKKYNDIDLVIDEDSYDQLIKAGIDELLARHIAHLFIRDPLVIYSESIELDDKHSTNHFENIQSTNWQTVRFKPPPPDAPIGWRVEFRTMEVQLTDFENAAFAVFIALVSRALLFFEMNLYIPLSKVDVNMQRAHIRDATNTQKFFFRSHMKTCDTDEDGDDSFEEMTMKQIICGKDDYFPGLVPVVKSYLDMIKCDADTQAVVDCYLSLIAMRASGEVMTAAQWMRAFVAAHPRYEHDSVLSEEIMRDLADTIVKIEQRTIEVPELLGELRNCPDDDVRPHPLTHIQTLEAEAAAQKDGATLSTLGQPVLDSPVAAATILTASDKQAVAPTASKVDRRKSVRLLLGNDVSAKQIKSKVPCSALREILTVHVAEANTIKRTPSATGPLSVLAGSTCGGTSPVGGTRAGAEAGPGTGTGTGAGFVGSSSGGSGVVMGGGATGKATDR